MDFKSMSDEDLKDIVLTAHTELDRRAERVRLPNNVREVALKWADTFPEDPSGWRDVTVY